MKPEVSGGSVYELGFLLAPEITETNLPEAFGSLKGVLLDKGAIAISEEFPKMIALAYTMEKNIDNKISRYNDAWFGWIKFELEAGDLAGIEAILRLRKDLVRYLITKTVRENTVASKRGFTPRRRPTKTEGVDGKEAAPEMTKEEIDREIDALVIDKEAA